IQRDTCTPMFIVYVGNLGTSVSRGELERAISYYGPLRNVWIVKNPPGFAFVEFEDPRHAEDAVRGLDGRVICDTRWTSGISRPPAQCSFDPSDKCYECGEKGHYAYDCHCCSLQRRSRSQSRSHLRSRGRRYSCSCSRSRERRSVSFSRSASHRRSRSGSIKESRSPLRSRSRSRSVSLPRSSQSPDLHLQKEVIPHQEVCKEVQVLKE
uniref:Serine/arginine-rich splicing factor 7 n=1 Tax=Ursus maritimus TaxID=29073 RepID=A0A452VEN4_URSMA